MNEYGKRVAKKMEDYMGDPNSVSKEINDIQNAIEGVEVRGALAAGVAKSFNKSKNAEEKAEEAHEITQDLLDETFDSAALEANFEQRLNDEIANLQPEWTGFKNNVTAQLAQIEAKTKYVTYDMFGVDGRKKFYNEEDGNYYLDEEFTEIYTVDDGEKIKMAHEYANENNLPVINLAGEYVITNTRDIPIKTNVNWGNTVFHVKESEAKRGRSWVFAVESENEWFDLPSSEFANILPALKKGASRIPSLADYKNHFVIVQDSTKRVGIRHGNDPDDGRAMQDAFYVDEGGELIGEVTWNFDNLTKVELVKTDTNYLKIVGGTFLLSGDLKHSNVEGEYLYTGIWVERSRTRISDQFVGMEGEDNAITASSGFYYFHRCYDVSLNNVRVVPRKITLPSGGTKGTYGIGGDNVVGLTLDNVNSEGGEEHWGVLGTNLIKNFTVSNSNLNRFDVHFHGWNISITNTKIGQKSIQISGGGDLFIQNVTVDSEPNGYRNVFCDFRADFGARWDGNIVIRDSKLKVNNEHYSTILNFWTESNDYGYPIVFGKNIYVENFVFDYSNNINNTEIADLMIIPSDRDFGGSRPSIASQVEFKNVTTTREMGCRLLNVMFPHLIQMEDKNMFDVLPGSINISKTNAYYKFDNVKTTERVSGFKLADLSHLNLYSLGSDPYTENSFVPKIEIVNCKNLNVHPRGSVMELVIDNSTINTVDAYEAGSRSKVSFLNSELRPNIPKSEVFAYFTFGADLTMINCKIFPIRVEGVVDYEKSKTAFNFFRLLENGKVYIEPGTYIGVRFSRDLHEYFVADEDYGSVIGDLTTHLLARSAYNGVQL